MCKTFDAFTLAFLVPHMTPYGQAKENCAACRTMLGGRLRKSMADWRDEILASNNEPQT